MEESDVREFIYKNFAVFNIAPTNKYFSINLNPTNQKAKLRYFIYQFHKKYDFKKAASKMKYVKLLINNFEIFRDDKPKTLSSNMGYTDRPAYPIPIEKYLN